MAARRRRTRANAAARAAFAALLWSAPAAAQTPEAAPSAFTETYGTWTVICGSEDTGDGESVRRCAMEQRFVWRDEGSGETRQLLTVTLRPAADGEVEAVALAPFGLLLPNGLRLRADEAEATVVLDFETCFPEGCVARAPLDAAALWSFRAGLILYVEADPAAGGDLFRLEGSLDGFGAAFARLDSETAP